MFKTVPITVQSTDKDKGQTDKTQAEDSGNRRGSTEPILSTGTTQPSQPTKPKQETQVTGEGPPNQSSRRTQTEQTTQITGQCQLTQSSQRKQHNTLY